VVFERDITFWVLLAIGLIAAAVIFVRQRQRYGPAKWDPRRPNTRERIIAAIWLVAFLAAAANHYGGWGFFGGYDKWVFGAALLIGFLLIRFLPGVTHPKS
jgi:hypothetical protein